MFACKTTVLENSFSIKAELSCETKTCRLVTAELRLNVSVNEKEPIPLLARQICDYGRKEEDGKTLVCDKSDRSITHVFCGDLHLS